jgi:copper chaperone CopZ
MHCDGCAATLEALVSTAEGVQAVSVTYKDSEARILFDPIRTSEDRLVALVQRPGYRVVGSSLPVYERGKWANAAPLLDECLSYVSAQSEMHARARAAHHALGA